MLEIKHIHKTFALEDEGKVAAVRDVSITVKQGEFYSLLGPSGCGKTTTLRCIAGLEVPSRGEIILDGEVVFSHEAGRFVPVHQRDIGMVFQSYAIWPHMNVFDNVAYPLKYGMGIRLSDNDIRTRVMEVLKLVQMDDRANRPAPQLSGGQQQRVALARALSRRPKILLLDEPLSNLDAKLREEMRIELRDLLHELGTTAVYVTHDQQEALTMSDRIAVMAEGQVVQEGTPMDIYLRPSKGFVARFIGNTNFLDGTTQQTNSESSVLVATPLGSIQCLCYERINPGQSVQVGVRPESITVSRVAPLDTPNVFKGSIERATFLGESVSGEIMVGSCLLRVKMRPLDTFSVGETVYVVLPPDLCIAWMN
jgi:iron(III) transport system ATP-binding protein